MAGERATLSLAFLNFVQQRLTKTKPLMPATSYAQTLWAMSFREMNLKKVHWGASILLIVSVTTFIWTQARKVNEDSFRFGKEFNSIRDSLRIPKIEADWTTHESTETFRFWSNPRRRVTSVEPMHLTKESKFNEDKILIEEDAFHYETGDSLAFRLIYQYNFGDSTWECRFIKYRKEKYHSSESSKLTLDQADSVLYKWGLRR